PIVAVPAVGATRLSTIRSVVVLPAPFGPRNPVTRPGWTWNDRLSTALTRLYCLVSPETTICPSDIGLPHVTLMSNPPDEPSRCKPDVPGSPWVFPDAILNGPQRSDTRITCFRPDQTSVTAQTFTSTRPFTRA